MLHPPFAVALAPCPSYEPITLQQTVQDVLVASKIIGPEGRLAHGSHVLVKPNLLRAHELTCTSPQVVRAICICLLEHGLKITVADSPGFGSAKAVAQSVGLAQALKDLGLSVQGFDKSTKVPVGNGKTWRIACLALESDAIISVPRLKAHCQLRLTIAVKNLFGCLHGMQKPVAHAVQGRCLKEFCNSIMQLWEALPPSMALVDAITAMHVTGPTHGKTFTLGAIGASTSALALDTAMYSMLGVEPSFVPLWQAAQKLNYDAAFTQNIDYVLKKPQDFNTDDFILPEELKDVSFMPHRLLQSMCKRFLSRYKL